jgi:hypothetical protein
MATADEFLEASQALIDAPSSGLGHWRRSISTSYYAAFHCVVEGAVDVLFRNAALANEVRQWFDHKPLSEVSGTLASMPLGSNFVSWSGARAYGLASPAPEFQQFGQRMRSLYDTRHAADYFKPEALHYGKGDARTALADARAVCDSVNTWRAEPNPTFERIAFTFLKKSVKASDR